MKFIEAVKSIIEPDSIDYVVVSHVEHDHSGSLPAILEVNNYRAEVLTHPMASKMINYYHDICSEG